MPKLIPTHLIPKNVMDATITTPTPTIKYIYVKKTQKQRREEMRCEFKIQECKNKTAQKPNDIIIQSNVNIDSAICYLFCSHLNVSFCDLAARFVFRLLLLGTWSKRNSFEILLNKNCASVANRVYCRYSRSMNAFYVCIIIWRTHDKN